MTKLATKQQGSVLPIVVLVVLVAAMAVFAYTRMNAAKTTAIESKSTYTSKSDISTAKSSLSSISVDSDLDTAQFDKDLSALK